jgi:beta-lactamase class A
MRPRDRALLDQELARIRSRCSGDLSLAAKNLATDETVLLDADVVYPTASVIKVAILLEVYAQSEAGLLRLDERLEMRPSDQVGGSGVLKTLMPGLRLTLYDLATLMIIKSDNTATNMCIDRVGGIEAVNRRVQDTYGLRSIVLHNRVDFDKIGPDVRNFAETTAMDFMRLMEMLARHEVVSPHASQEMLRILSRQQYLDQFPRYLNVNPYAQELQLAQDLVVQNKTGFFPGTGVDAGVIRLPEDVSVAYYVVCHHAADTSVAPETEASVINGLVGRALIRHWWPRDDVASATMPTCYVSG